MPTCTSQSLFNHSTLLEATISHLSGGRALSLECLYSSSRSLLGMAYPVNSYVARWPSQFAEPIAGQGPTATIPQSHKAICKAKQRIRKPKAPTQSESVWESNRAHINALYIVQRKTLAEVMTRMEEQYGFYASYVYRISSPCCRAVD